MIYLINVAIALAITGVILFHATWKVWRRKVKAPHREIDLLRDVTVPFPTFLAVETQDVNCPFCGDDYRIPMYLMERRDGGRIIIPCRTCGKDFMIGREGDGVPYRRRDRLG